MRLIDADALEKYLSDAEIEATRQRKYVFASALNTICGNVRNFPTIKPERKKGKWKEYDSDEDKYDVIKCPCCMHMFTVDSYHWTDISFVKDDFKFCPNCGADMRGEQNEL